MILEDKWIGGNLSSGGVLREKGDKEMRRRDRVNLIAGQYWQERGD
jgi:hypothetical protein